MNRINKKVPEILLQSLGKIARLPLPIPAQVIEKIDESLTPNMRALRLVLTISEKLLSMGVSARDVVHMMLGITRTYCKQPVHMDISSTLITVSQDRGINREPLTLIRAITLVDVNYQTIQALQTLSREIRYQHIHLSEAEERLEKIINPEKRHPQSLVALSGGALSAGVVVMYGGSLQMALLAMAVGTLSTAAMRLLWRIGVSVFFTQIIMSLCITLIATAVVCVNTKFNLAFNPTLIVIGGIVLLVAGMMIVGAFQDAIDEYYVTANARLLRVLMATSGIVVGVAIGLHIATRLGISFPTTPDRLTLVDNYTQYIGAAVIASAFVIGNHAPFFGTILAGIVGASGWGLFQLLTDAGWDVLLASGAAAAAIGLVATFMSRLWRIPSLAIIGAGIVPLVPGLSLYNGLMGIISQAPSDPGYVVALASLARAVMIGFAVAVGASFGNAVGRPIRSQIRKLFVGIPTTAE